MSKWIQISLHTQHREKRWMSKPKYFIHIYFVYLWNEENGWWTAYWHILYSTYHAHTPTHSNSHRNLNFRFDYGVLSIYVLVLSEMPTDKKILCGFVPRATTTANRKNPAHFSLDKACVKMNRDTHTYKELIVSRTILFTDAVSAKRTWSMDIEVMSNTHVMTVNDLFDCLLDVVLSPTCKLSSCSIRLKLDHSI